MNQYKKVSYWMGYGHNFYKKSEIFMHGIFKFVSITEEDTWIEVRWKHDALVKSISMGLNSFLNLLKEMQLIYVKCVNGRQHVVGNIRTHLICDGIARYYTRWIWHGEKTNMPMVSQTKHANVELEDRLKDMILDVGQ